MNTGKKCKVLKNFSSYLILNFLCPLGTGVFDVLEVFDYVQNRNWKYFPIKKCVTVWNSLIRIHHLTMYKVVASDFQRKMMFCCEKVAVEMSVDVTH